MFEGGELISTLQIVADYADKHGTQARALLEKRGRGMSNSSTASGIDKGPSVCSVDQSAITGESLAVDKFVGDVAYYTCGVKRGKVYAVVTASAPYSFVGKTARLVLCTSRG